jgi:hypothetical protein
MRTSKRRTLLSSTFFASVLGWLLVASGCAGLQQASGNGGNLPGGGGNPTPASAAVSICDASKSNCQAAAASFSLAGVPDLNVAVNWTNVPAGTHSQEIRLLMPNGNLYQRFQNSFLVPANDSNGSANVSRNIPITGTFITERQITGGWKVEVSLDGKVTTIGNLQLNP